MGKPSKRSEAASKADKFYDKELQFYKKVRDTLTSLSVQKEISKEAKHMDQTQEVHDRKSKKERHKVEEVGILDKDTKQMKELI